MQTGAQVADKAVQEILSRIDQLAAKIGTTAAHVWDIYVAQGKITGYQDAGSALVFLVLGVALLVVSYVITKSIVNAEKTRVDNLRKTKSEYYENRASADFSPYSKAMDVETDYSTLWIAVPTGIIGLALLFSSFNYGSSAISEILNPQYWAFQHLMQDLKNLL